MPMKFVFDPWEFGGDTRNARAMADLLQQRAEKPAMAGLLRTSGPADSTIHFLVVDVTRSSRPANELAHALAKMMRPGGGPWTGTPAFAVARFLFVGETSALDAWEVEEEDTISVKKSVEFYIRALQSARIAHYGTGGPDAANLNPSLADSALLGLVRYYEKRETPPLEDLVAGVREQIQRVFDHARAHHAHLIDIHPDLDSEASNANLLLSLNAVSQLGKRWPKRAYDEGWAVRFTPARSHHQRGGQPGAEGAELERPSSYGLLSKLDERISEWGEDGAPANGARTLPIADLSLGLHRYNLLRDLARCIGTGAISALIRQGAEIRDWGILIVDDGLYDDVENGGEKGLAEKLLGKLSLTGWQDVTFVARSEAFRITDSRDLIADDERLQKGLEVRALDPSRAPPAGKPRPEDFRLILVEIDPGVDYLGAKLVNRIAAYLEKANDPKRRSAWRESAAPPQTPPIIVLTRTESFGQIQQSLNFGAVAYLLKDRLYQLPYQMHLALDAAARDDTPHSSSFRALHKLRPEVKAKLKTRKNSSLLHGGRSYSDEEGQHMLADEREQQWVRELPKADLHCHMGTCIHPAAIHLLALNTFGHMMDSAQLGNEARKRAIDRTVLSVILAEHFHASAKGAIPPLICLAVAAAAVGAPGRKSELPDFGIGNRIIGWLGRPNDDLKSFQITAMLAAAMGWEADPDGSPPPEVFEYLDALAILEEARGDSRPTHQTYDRREALHIALRGAMDEVFRIAKSRRPPERFTSADKPRLWASLSTHVKQRIESGRGLVDDKRNALWSMLTGPDRDWLFENLSAAGLQAAIDAAVAAFGVDNIARLSRLRDEADIKRGFQLPTRQTMRPERLAIQRYVELPTRESSRFAEGSLRRYLWGADLLGADHLQYPENLLIAAFAIVSDNVRDNVIYSEIRCETPGYREAGMSALEATNVLRRGFDLAALYLAHAKKDLPLVRINILLAAKRHKDEAAANEVVHLLTGYLNEHDDERYWNIYPERWWWQPSRVVGFDLSGDESVDPPWLPRIRELLAKISSPITIHAGEAANVERIKVAIHNHHARRIGHGLKLRADRQLQQYCVREGICMEMCPNSNFFTNIYELPHAGDPSPMGTVEFAYPLRDYMEEGLEVCLATDNRYIHRAGTQTLTSEYMTAARLSGGLTRWEILQLIKAGFKNAFLPKKEVEALISAMEERVYRMISRGWF